MIHFVGAGPGAVDLITLRGARLLGEADIIIYAGSLVNPELLSAAKDGCQIYNSAQMHLGEVLDVMKEAEKKGLTTVRLHTGDPSIYGAIQEQMEALRAEGISFDVTPGVSSFCGAAATLNLEYTLPGVSQSVIITRMAGKTKVPPKEEIELFAAHQTTMVIFLSAGAVPMLQERLLEGGYHPDTPAAIVYKATWPEEKKYICTVGTLSQCAKEHGISKTTLFIIGDVVSPGQYEQSKLYDKEFSTEYRIRK